MTFKVNHQLNLKMDNCSYTNVPVGKIGTDFRSEQFRCSDGYVRVIIKPKTIQ